MKEEEKQNDLVMMKRGRTSDSRIVRNSLMWVANDATWDPWWGGSWSVLLLIGEGHVSVHGPAVTGVRYYQRPLELSSFGLLPGGVLRAVENRPDP